MIVTVIGLEALADQCRVTALRIARARDRVGQMPICHLCLRVRKEPAMIMTRLAIAALMIVSLIGMPFAAQAKKYRHVRHHHVPVIQSNSFGATGTSTAPSAIYGTSGTSIGTVTAPSIGSYYWPSVGVTNAVPTWRNTNPR